MSSKENSPTIITNKALAIDRSKLEELREMVAPGLNNAQWDVFVETCAATGLNPILKEIWGFVSQGRLVTMIGIQGYHYIVGTDPNFDGWEKPEFAYDKEGNLVSCTVQLFMKHISRPIVQTAYWAEYGAKKAAKGGAWAEFPHLRLQQVAEALAIKRACPARTAGTYAQAELEASGIIAEEKRRPRKEKIDETEVISQPVRYKIPEITDKQISYLQSIGGKEIETGIWELPAADAVLEKKGYRI